MIFLEKHLKSSCIICVILLSLTIFTGCSRNNDPGAGPTAEKYADGDFTGYSDAADDGYAWAKVHIQGNKIGNVELMEITAKGNEKDYQTYDYQPAVEAHNEMPGRFVTADSADVNIYSGATESSERYKQAVKRALLYARGGLEGKYFDGVFQGTSERTDYGHAVALVTLKGDKIMDVVLKETTQDGEQWRDYASYDYEPAVEAHQEMAKRFVDANSIEVDMYTEATQSSIRYKEAVRRALRHARKDPTSDVE